MKRISLGELEEVGKKPSAGKVLALPHKRDEPLSPALCHILAEVQRELGADQDEDAGLLTENELAELVQAVATRAGFELSPYERDQILAQLERESKPFGVLQELVDASEVSDIIVKDYCHIAFQSVRETHKTDLRFSSQEAYEAFVEKLLQRVGATYSTKKPVADGMVGSFARIHVVHRSLCETGPYLTIRLNRYRSVAITDLAESGLAPRPLLQYLAKIIQTGQTILIVGEVGTGKTTLARALAGSIPSTESLLVIEDTPEIRLEHPQARYITTREANMDGEGRVAPAYCIRAGMRMAMNRIIFGEIRDAEAAEAFIDVCSSGHPGLSTIHARSAGDALTRLELFLGRAQRGVGRDVLSQQISTAVQVVIFINICKVTGGRRIIEVKEIGAAADGVIRQRDMFRYQSANGRAEWEVLSKSSNFRDQLESGEDPVFLSRFQNVMELSTSFGSEQGAQTL